MNNVAALALMMPVAIAVSRSAQVSPSLTLMPLSFISMLGGLITLIGTPPNVIIASVRADRLGEAFHLFDFAPVGLAVSAGGLALIELIGWRPVPQRLAAGKRSEERCVGTVFGGTGRSRWSASYEKIKIPTQQY